MPLLRALNTIPLWTLIVGLLAVFELYSVGLMLLARRKWGIDRLKLKNEVAGFKFSIIGVLYAVLLALSWLLFGRITTRPKLPFATKQKLSAIWHSFPVR